MTEEQPREDREISGTNYFEGKGEEERKPSPAQMFILNNRTRRTEEIHEQENHDRRTILKWLAAGAAAIGLGKIVNNKMEKDVQKELSERKRVEPHPSRDTEIKD